MVEKEEKPRYREGLTYICTKECGTQITVNSPGEGGPITCCGLPVRRGRVLAIAPRQVGATAEHLTTAYRLYASEGDFDETVSVSGRLMMVEFSAPWCGACKAMDPVLDGIAQEYAGRVLLVEVDVDQSPSLPGRFKVRSVPHLLFLREGRVEGRLVGQVAKKEIVKELEARLKEV